MWYLKPWRLGCRLWQTGLAAFRRSLKMGVTGLMVEPRNPEAMAKTIFQLLSNADLRSRLGAAARERAESAHTPEAYRRALVEFYQETLRNRVTG